MSSSKVCVSIECIYDHYSVARNLIYPPELLPRRDMTPDYSKLLPHSIVCLTKSIPFTTHADERI
jgi:hypothetical protein